MVMGRSHRAEALVARHHHPVPTAPFRLVQGRVSLLQQIPIVVRILREGADATGHREVAGSFIPREPERTFPDTNTDPLGEDGGSRLGRLG